MESNKGIYQLSLLPYSRPKDPANHTSHTQLGAKSSQITPSDLNITKRQTSATGQKTGKKLTTLHATTKITN